jgi:hypothetical protein
MIAKQLRNYGGRQMNMKRILLCSMFAIYAAMLVPGHAIADGKKVTPPDFRDPPPNLNGSEKARALSNDATKLNKGPTVRRDSTRSK